MSDVDGGATPPEGRTQTGRAVALVVVVVLVALLVLRHTGTSSIRAATGPTTTTTVKTHTPAPVPTTSTTIAVRPPQQVTVQVLNGLQSGNLAGNLTKRLGTDGYLTSTPNDTTTPTQTSTIYLARRGFYREAKALATSLGLPFSDIRRSIPAGTPIPPGVTGNDLVVVIGASLQQLASST